MNSFEIQVFVNTNKFNGFTINQRFKEKYNNLLLISYEILVQWTAAKIFVKF